MAYVLPIMQVSTNAAFGYRPWALVTQTSSTASSPQTSGAKRGTGPVGSPSGSNVSVHLALAACACCGGGDVAASGQGVTPAGVVSRLRRSAGVGEGDPSHCSSWRESR